MSSTEHDADLEPASESTLQAASEASYTNVQVPQPDSPTAKHIPEPPTGEDMPESPSSPTTAFELYNEDVTSKDEEATVPEIETQNDETLTALPAHSPVSEASKDYHPYLPELAGESQSTLPIPDSQTQSETVQEPVVDISNASTAPADGEDLMEIARPTREVIDLTDDDPDTSPSLVPEVQKLKQEPDDGMAPAGPIATPNQPTKYELFTAIDLDPMDVNQVPEDTHALPVLEGTDDAWQFSPEDRAEETEKAMLMINAAAHSFRSSLPMNPHSSTNPAPTADDFESSDVIEINSDVEDALAVVNFEEMQTEYLRNQKAGKLDLGDEVEFNRAKLAEDERKRRRARNNARHASPQTNDQSMFFPDDGRRSPSPASGAVDAEIDLLMRYENPEPAMIPQAVKGDKKPRGRPKGSKTTINGGIRKPNRAQKLGKDGKPLMTNSVNFGSLLSNDLIAVAQENQKRESQPTFTSKTKTKALTELISSMPKEQQKLYQVDKRELYLASRKFAGKGFMRSDGAGGWKLKGMKSSLHHYQLLGAAFMRDLENVGELS